MSSPPCFTFLITNYLVLCQLRIEGRGPMAKSQTRAVRQWWVGFIVIILCSSSNWDRIQLQGRDRRIGSFQAALVKYSSREWMWTFGHIMPRRTMTELRSVYVCQPGQWQSIYMNTPSIVFVPHTESKLFVLKYLNAILPSEHMLFLICSICIKNLLDFFYTFFFLIWEDSKLLNNNRVFESQKHHSVVRQNP